MLDSHEEHPLAERIKFASVLMKEVDEKGTILGLDAEDSYVAYILEFKRKLWAVLNIVTKYVSFSKVMFGLNVNLDFNTELMFRIHPHLEELFDKVMLRNPTAYSDMIEALSDEFSPVQDNNTGVYSTNEKMVTITASEGDVTILDLELLPVLKESQLLAAELIPEYWDGPLNVQLGPIEAAQNDSEMLGILNEGISHVGTMQKTLSLLVENMNKITGEEHKWFVNNYRHFSKEVDLLSEHLGQMQLYATAEDAEISFSDFSYILQCVNDVVDNVYEYCNQLHNQTLKEVDEKLMIPF